MVTNVESSRGIVLLPAATAAIVQGTAAEARSAEAPRETPLRSAIAAAKWATSLATAPMPVRKVVLLAAAAAAADTPEDAEDTHLRVKLG